LGCREEAQVAGLRARREERKKKPPLLLLFHLKINREALGLFQNYSQGFKMHKKICKLTLEYLPISKIGLGIFDNNKNVGSF